MIDTAAIKTAEPEDASKVLDFLVREFLPRHPMGTLNPTKALAAMRQFCIDGVVLYAELEGQVIGAFVATVNDLWFSDDVMLHEICFFVHPEHRATGVARMMAKMAKEQARRAAIPLVIVQMTGDDVARQNRFYERLDMKHLGCIWRTE